MSIGIGASDDRRVVIVGGGHAGGTLAGLLRQGGFIGEVILIGDEPDPPYHRPPLSKSFDEDGLEQWLRDFAFYEEQNIDLHLDEEVVSINRDPRRVVCASGRVVDYDVLVLATGAAPRSIPVPGSELEGVLGLRTLADARQLRAAVAQDGGVVVIGGGYVGLEVAATVRAQGGEATVVERESRILARVASTALSEILTEHHRRNGTSIRTGAQVTELAEKHGKVRGVVLSDGTEIPCGSVLVGIGAVPRERLAEDAGLACDGGIVVDSLARTSDPTILAIGDVTRRPLPGRSEPVRLESIPSAVEQAKQAAAGILGEREPAPEVPWFWSDQFDLKLKIAGVPGRQASAVCRGDTGSGKFALFHHEGGVVSCVESANAAAEFMMGRKLIAKGSRVDPARLEDPDTPLRNAVSQG